MKEFIEYDKPILCEFNRKINVSTALVPPGKVINEMILEDNGQLNIMGNIAPS